MIRIVAFLTLAGALAGTAETPLRWQFAGENQGIRFFFKIANECRESGAKVDVKLENTLDHPVTVSFRLVDPEWKQSFERDVGPRMKDMAVKFTPEEGSACHPYVDEVYVASKSTAVTDAGAPESQEESKQLESPETN